MQSRDLSPLAVVPYSKDYLVAFIRHQTGWDQRSQVSDKIQLNYLCNYLEVDHIKAKTIVVENEYIDRHYLEDYSEYYARCFPSHPRKCSRVHFFSNDFDENQFISVLESPDYFFLEELSKHYIGFAVIRPIPHTFLAKLCLKRYDELISTPECHLIAKPIRVSLFGLTLEVQSAAFLEQDKVVSACATSALWMFFNASGQNFNGSLPSPSSITKSATGSAFDSARTFPTTGLSPPQVARSLKHFGFEPMLVELGSDWNEFKEIIYGYVSNNVPVLIGGSIYRKSSDEQIKHAGKHLVCALGYRLSKDALKDNGDMQLISHRTEKIYVHDDRYGPYVRVSMNPNKFAFNGEERAGLKLSLLGVDENEYFVPDMAIVGIYHKVRLTYFDIRDMCDSLFLYLHESHARFDSVVKEKKYTTPEGKAHYEILAESVHKLIHGICDITLTTNTDIKEELRSNDSFNTFNGIASKSACLLQSMPKYIWRCRILARTNEPNENDQLFTDILFDATEVAQGQVLVGYITYNNIAERVWKHVENSICNNLWDTYKVNSETKLGISGFLKFFSKYKNKTNLNTLYGPLGLPRRHLKQGELDNYNNIHNRSDIQVIRAGNTSYWEKLNVELNKSYIWVINEAGDLVLGEDIREEGKSQGHPTLVDGNPARIGGELFYSTKDKCWLVNLKSGTYSSHIKPNSPLWHGYLNNVLQENFIGANVKIECVLH